METPESSSQAIPDGITREHVLEAIADYERDGRPPGFGHSHTYDLVHDDRTYPPPAILALAAKQATGMLPPSGFPVGKGSKCFTILRQCGFEIVRKNPKPSA